MDLTLEKNFIKRLWYKERICCGGVIP